MATPRFIDINLKFRRTIKDDRKKDDTPYTSADMTEGTDNVNAGQLTNQEVADLATEAINNYLQATVMQKAQLIMQKRRNNYSFNELTIEFPEYTFYKTYSLSLSLVDVGIGVVPDDYIFFVSASAIHMGTTQENYRYVTPYTIDILRNAAYEEDRVTPYIYMQSYPGGSPMIQVFRPVATAGAGTTDLTFRYIGKQKNIVLNVEDALINSFHDSAIVQEMVRLFENKQRLTD